jgi:hypothetical protein
MKTRPTLFCFTASVTKPIVFQPLIINLVVAEAARNAIEEDGAHDFLLPGVSESVA